MIKEQVSSEGATELPPEELTPRVTHLLRAWSEGDPNALEELIPLVNDELRFMARREFQGEGRNHLLQPTALVHEFFLHLKGRRKVSWENRRQFFGYAAGAMHRILVSHAREQKRLKRGGGKTRLSLGPEHENVLAENPNQDLILAVHEALEELKKIDADAVEIVRLRFFVGMTVEETAAALGKSRAAVNREWSFAKVWLFQRLRESSGDIDLPPSLHS